MRDAPPGALPDRDAVLARAATLLAHDPALPDEAVVPPIHQTSLFTFANYRDMADTFAGRQRRPVYSRGDNPTVMAFEQRVAALEYADAARACSSGMGAISATVLAFAGQGDRIVAIENLYGDTYRFFERLLPGLGIRVDYVDGSDAEAIERALPGAKLLYLESPNSMMFAMQDLPRLAAAARAAGVISMVDNSWATPLFQQPILHGADLVVHSASKYLGGHSDTVAGVVAGRAELIERINTRTQPFLGAKLSPIEGFLLLRGLRTLPLRIPRHEQSARTIATRLREHAQVIRVHHPMFANHQGAATLLGTTGLFSFEVDERTDVPALVDALHLFRIGVSWGGHESLVCPAQATLEQTPGVNSLSRFGVSKRLIRLHIGLEDAEALWDDLAASLAAARR
jgi:cystathionine beta-lyase/cystathionine gamma-synthase